MGKNIQCYSLDFMFKLHIEIIKSLGYNNCINKLIGTKKIKAIRSKY